MNEVHSGAENAESSRLIQAVAELRGQEVSRVDRLYGGALSLHLGSMIPGRRRDRGRWIVTSWGGDWVIAGPTRTVDSRRDREEEVQAALELIVGSEVAAASLDPRTLSLTLNLNSGVTLDLSLDRSYDGDAWTLSLPTRETISVHSNGSFSMQADTPSDKQ